MIFIYTHILVSKEVQSLWTRWLLNPFIGLVTCQSRPEFVWNAASKGLSCDQYYYLFGRSGRSLVWINREKKNWNKKERNQQPPPPPPSYALKVVVAKQKVRFINLKDFEDDGLWALPFSPTLRPRESKRTETGTGRVNRLTHLLEQIADGARNGIKYSPEYSLSLSLSNNHHHLPDSFSERS